MKEKHDSKKNVRRTTRNSTHKMTTRCRKDKQETTAGHFNRREKRKQHYPTQALTRRPQWSNEEAQEWKNKRRRTRYGKEKSTQTGNDTKTDGAKGKRSDRNGEVETVDTTS